MSRARPLPWIAALLCLLAAAPATAAGPDERAVAWWQTGRRLRAAGALSSLSGGGIGLGGTLVEALGAPAVGRPLLYAATGTLAAGFTLSAVGLGLQHRGLERLGVDPGRGIFVAGTVLGAAGLLAAGTIQIVRGADLAPEPQRGALVLTLGISGLACLVAMNVLYLVDGHRMRGALAGWLARQPLVPGTATALPR